MALVHQEALLVERHPKDRCMYNQQKDNAFKAHWLPKTQTWRGLLNTRPGNNGASKHNQSIPRTGSHGLR